MSVSLLRPLGYVLIKSRRAKFALARSADDTLDTVVDAFIALSDEEQAVRKSFD